MHLYIVRIWLISFFMLTFLECNSCDLPFFFSLTTCIYHPIIFIFSSFFEDTNMCGPILVLLLVCYLNKKHLVSLQTLDLGRYPPGLSLLLCCEINTEKRDFLVSPTESNNTSVVTSIPSILFWIYQYHSLIKEARLLERVVDSRAEAGKIQGS